MHLSVISSSTEISLGAHPSVGFIYPFIDKISVLLSCRWQFPASVDMMQLALHVSAAPVDVQGEGDFWLGSLVVLMANRAWLFLPVMLSWLPVWLLTKPERQICIWSDFCSLSPLHSWKEWYGTETWHLFFCQNPILLLLFIDVFL